MPPLEVVVLGAIDDEIGDLASEVQRIKATLPYGDRVCLSTHKIPLLLARIALKTRVLPDALRSAGGLSADLARGLADELERRWGSQRGQGDHVADDADRLLDLLRGSERDIVLELPEVLAAMIREGKGTTPDPQAWFRSVGPVALENHLRSNPVPDPALVTSAFAELLELSRAALVEIEGVGETDLNSVPLDEIEASFSGAVTDALALLADSGRREHPLLTRSVRLALTATHNDGGVGGIDFSRANRVELAARLVADVPTFPLASVDEIVDLRARVRPHLKRFRAAVAVLEDELAADVIDIGFDNAVEELRLRHVDPALEELRCSLREEGAARSLARTTPTMAASTLALGASVALGAPDITAATAVAAGLATAAANEFLARHKRHDERSKHRLFLLFDVEQALAR